MRSQRARRDPRDPSCCTSAGTLPESDSGGRVRGRGVGRIQCTEQGLLQRWCGWCGWGGPSPGATAVLGSRREMGQSLSVGSPVVRGICRGPSACVTAPLTPSRSLPARSQLSASASGKNRAGRKKKWRRTDGNETVRCVKSQLNPTPASNLNVTVFYCVSLKQRCLSTVCYGLLMNSLTLGGSTNPQYRSAAQTQRPVRHFSFITHS